MPTQQPASYSYILLEAVIDDILSCWWINIFLVKQNKKTSDFCQFNKVFSY